MSEPKASQHILNPVSNTEENETIWKQIVEGNSSESHFLYTLPLQKPHSDHKEYRLIKLSNGLEVMLVHDAKSDKAAACMNLNVGGCHDPVDRPGLAHFCEHMLFLGTEKFPEENEYKKYIEKNNGTWNAFTNMSNTCYQFSVAADALEGALDRFSAFFYCPLFTPSATAREVSTVDSEYKMYLQQDGWRQLHVMKTLMEPNNPISKFLVGNMSTLLPSLKANGDENTAVNDSEKEEAGKEARQHLIEWWKRWYCATNMSLVLIGKESLDQLQSYAKSYFRNVPNRGFGPAARISDYPLKKENSGVIAYMKTVKDFNSLDFDFPMPYYSNDLWNSKAHVLISKLLSNRGPGSIMAFLNEQGWVSQSGCCIHPNNLSNGASQFSISVGLTKDGLKNYMTVIGLFKSFIQLLQNSATADWFYHEIKDMAYTDFNYTEEVDAYHYAIQLSQYMKWPTPRNLILSAPELYWEHDEEQYRSVLNALDFNNCQIYLLSKDLDQIGITGPWEKEKWFGAEYKVVKFSEEFYHKPLEHPVLIKKNASCEVWYKCDDQFQIPKAGIRLQILSPVASKSLESQIMTLCYREMVADSLKELSYEARRAGDKGFGVWVDGYADKLDVFLMQVLQKLKSYRITEEKLAFAKEEVQKQLKNFLYLPTFRLSHYYTNLLFTKGRHDKRDLLQAITGDGRKLHSLFRKEPETGITVTTMEKYAKDFFSSVHLRILINGSIVKEDTTQMLQQIEDILEANFTHNCCMDVSPQAHLLTKSCNYIVEIPLSNPDEVNSATGYFCKIGDVSNPKDRVIAYLLEQVIKDAAFNTLRTQESLGYVVHTKVFSGTEYIGLAIAVQSEKHPKFVESRINAFISKMKGELLSMSEDEFRQHKESLVSGWTEKLKNLDEEADRFWSHITDGYLDFRQAFNDSELVRKITKDDLLTAFSNNVDPSSSKRSKLSLHLLPKSLKTHTENIDLGSDVMYFQDFNALKEQLPVSDVPKPVEEFGKMLQEMSK
ncbi:hypothetical protein SCHPADRAFT_925084 [Schizopora paradoxa]|uniref:Insulin-degrading enzyme n=1 Tax=Schizopora paradoxa TaxID=27342 RepID=A0A0H2S3M8_9AGAM|nr:hypothetical protein SCHPADRAFT_925084 [Schizopora paradoxa]